MAIPSYQTVEEIFLDNKAEFGVSEAHGMLAGMLCANPDVVGEHWLSLVFGAARGGLVGGELDIIRDLCLSTRGLIEAFDFSFQLFLPDDGVELTERAQALKGWCQGFLFGVGYAGAQGKWSDDCSEILRDFEEISKLDAIASGEADEEAFVEICEFVRMGVQLLHSDFLQDAPLRTRLH